MFRKLGLGFGFFLYTVATTGRLSVYGSFLNSCSYCRPFKLCLYFWIWISVTRIQTQFECNVLEEIRELQVFHWYLCVSSLDDGPSDSLTQCESLFGSIFWQTKLANEKNVLAGQVKKLMRDVAKVSHVFFIALFVTMHLSLSRFKSTSTRAVSLCWSTL